MNMQALLNRALPRWRGRESVFTRLWRWWSTEILHFVPPRLRDALDKQERTLYVAVKDSDLIVEYRHGSERERVRRLSLVQHAEAGALDEDAPEADRVILELSPAQAARRQVSLPLGAEERLNEVLGYEMDRLTPFASKDVYFDYKVSSRDASRRVVNLELVVALRRSVDEILGRLEQRRIEVSQVTLASAPAINLLPKDRRAAEASRLPIVPTLLTGVAAILAVVALAFPLLNQHAELARLEAEVAELRPAALAADNVRSEIEASVRESGFLATKWHSVPTKIRLLNELAGVIPDDTWLTRVQVSGGIARLHGESEGASSLIGLIEASALFSDVRFSSPVTKNPRTSNDRFVIEARISDVGDSP